MKDRTRAQLADVLKKDGTRAHEAYLRERAWCPECGAIPGYKHSSDCKTDKYPSLSR
jgi:hypothetical protein